MSLPHSKCYFTQFEKELILVLAEPHLKVIENKETNGVTCIEKANAFAEISKRFNDTYGVNLRTAKQIRQCYQNLKKKLRQKATSLRQERRKTGGGEVSKEVQLSSLEMGLLAGPMLTLPLSTVCDSDTSEMEILKSQGQIISAANPVVCPLTPSHSATAEASELDTSNIDYFDDSCEGLTLETPECETSVSAEASGAKRKSKQNSLRETLMMFRKNTKRQTAPSAAARAAACIEAEHSETKKYMQKEEERKEQQAEAARKEHELRIELLQEQIKLTKTKTLVNEKLLDLMDKDPSAVNVFKNLLS